MRGSNVKGAGREGMNLSHLRDTLEAKRLFGLDKIFFLFYLSINTYTLLLYVDRLVCAPVFTPMMSFNLFVNLSILSVMDRILNERMGT